MTISLSLSFVGRWLKSGSLVAAALVVVRLLETQPKEKLGMSVKRIRRTKLTFFLINVPFCNIIYYSVMNVYRVQFSLAARPSPRFFGRYAAARTRRRSSI